MEIISPCPSQRQSTVHFDLIDLVLQLCQIIIIYRKKKAMYELSNAFFRFQFTNRNIHYKMLRFHLILWCGISLETHIFSETLGLAQCIKYRSFTHFPGVEILWKGSVSAMFWVNCPKLRGNCAFPQNFHTKK